MDIDLGFGLAKTIQHLPAQILIAAAVALKQK